MKKVILLKIMMWFFLMVIIVLVIVIPPAGLVAAGVFLYWVGKQWEKENKESESVREVRINEYDYEVLEEMK